MPYKVLAPFNSFGTEIVGNTVLREDVVEKWPEGTAKRRVENGFLEIITENTALDIEIANGTADMKKVKAREVAEKAAADARAKAEKESVDAAIEAERVAAEKALADEKAKADAAAKNGGK